MALVQVTNADELRRWRWQMLVSDLDVQTKFVLLVLAQLRPTDEHVIHVSQSRVCEQFKIPQSTFSGRYARAKESDFVEVVESRSGSAARWDDDPWTDKIALTFDDEGLEAPATEPTVNIWGWGDWND